MGTFDDIVVEFELPNHPRPNLDTVFQTKDLECCLQRLYITKAGRLEVNTYGPGPWTYSKVLKDHFKRLVPIGRKEYTANIHGERYTGDITFYTSHYKYNNEKHEGWIEYVAHFKDGQLTMLDVMTNKG